MLGSMPSAGAVQRKTGHGDQPSKDNETNGQAQRPSDAEAIANHFTPDREEANRDARGADAGRPVWEIGTLDIERMLMTMRRPSNPARYKEAHPRLRSRGYSGRR